MKDKPENQQWIAIKHRLPPEHENVLVRLDGDTFLIGIMDSNNRWSIYWSDGRHNESLDRPVTHWMEIPQLPDAMLAERSKSDE